MGVSAGVRAADDGVDGEGLGGWEIGCDDEERAGAGCEVLFGYCGGLRRLGSD